MAKLPVLITYLAILILLSSCNVVNSDNEKADYIFSFENGINEWDLRGRDLIVGGEEVDWNITHTTEKSADTPGSVRFFLENSTDAGKIWIERALHLKPNQYYNVKLTFSFGTADYGDINYWTIIAGAHQHSPESSEDLKFQDSTFNGKKEKSGYIWKSKSYSFLTQTDKQGRLIITLGVWGTWETKKVYYMDDVHLYISES